MKRETSNAIRFAIEDLLPPLVRDSQVFRLAAQIVWGKHIDHLADFRRRAPLLTAEEYEQLYLEHPRVHEGTDNTAATVDRIILDVTGHNLCDVGCGTGHLLRLIREAKGCDLAYTGVDFIVPDQFKGDGFTFVEAPVEQLPFEDHAFDTVICTHVIEHILDYRAAIAELRRITKKRLIIVVPREREGIYTFNPHFNFFPYAHSFLRAMIPLPLSYQCDIIGRDIYYIENVGDR